MIKTETTTLTEFKTQRDRVLQTLATERFEALPLLAEFIPQIASAFQGSGFVKLPAYEGVGKQHHAFLDMLKKHPYHEIRLLRAYRPLGLKTTYLDYLKTLAKCLDHVQNLRTAVLEPYATSLAMLVTNSDAALTSDNKAAFNHALMAQREALEAEVLEHLAPMHSTETTVGEVIARNEDWVAVFTLADDVEHQLTKLNLTSIEKKMKECQGYLDHLYELASQNSPRLKNATPEALTALAETAFQIASELEFLSVTYYRLLTTAQAIKDTEASLMKAFGK